MFSLQSSFFVVRKQKRQAHPEMSLPECLQIMNCTNAGLRLSRWYLSYNTYSTRFAQLGNSKKSPAFLQGSNGTNRVSAQFILIASHPRGGCQKPATRRFRMTLIDYSSAPGVKSNADSQTRITDMALYELGISPRLCIPCWCPRTGAMSAHCISTASFYSQKILVQDVPLPTVLTFEI